MRRVRYCVAVSLDGFIAGPKGEFDWITMDPTMDFDQFYKQFDTILMGRKTFEIAGGGGGSAESGMRTLVCSRTLRQSDCRRATVVKDAGQTVSDLKRQNGKDIWLFGGGDLFRSLLDAKLVDTVELGVMPVLLSAGIPVLAEGDRSPTLRLLETKSYGSRIVGLSYSVDYPAGKKRRRSAAGVRRSL